jgi:ureidoacrylate peracid hydrolase
MRHENSSFSIQPRAGVGPPGYGHALTLQPSTSALIVVDMQRFFVDAAPFEAMRRVVPSIARVLDAARAAGITVVHVKTEFRADMADAGRPGSRTRQMMESAAGGLRRGGQGAEIASALAPAPSDLVVVKKCFSGFAATDLHDVLSQRRIETLLFAGGTTTVCVESTLRDGMFLGYDGVLLADCTADMSAALQESALQRVDMFFGWVCDSSDLLAWLGGERLGARSCVDS